MSETIIVIGAGQAGSQLVTSLRSEGFDGRLILIGDEPHLPYQRPPLSKQFLAGEVDIERIFVKPANFYQKSDVELLLGNRVSAIDRGKQQVTLSDGSQLDYDKLALATGSRARKLALPGAELGGVLYLRNIADMQALQERLRPGARLVIVGGGYIGLEVASVAVRKGVRVTVLEMAERLLRRVAGPRLSAFYNQVHTAHGADIRCGVKVTGFAGDGNVERVLCQNDGDFAADVVLVGVGIVPNVELAQAAGLAAGNGIVVDDYARTADPAIVAVGDCANHPSRHYGRRLRLESVPNALAQSRAAAGTLCGQLKAYDEVPWFWSDQYDLKLQIAGLIESYDQVVQRGDPEQRQFMLCYLQQGELIGVESVNQPREFMAARQLVAERAIIAPEQLADTSVALKDLAA